MKDFHDQIESMLRDIRHEIGELAHQANENAAILCGLAKSAPRRKNVSAADQRTHLACLINARVYSGRCPCCAERVIVAPDGARCHGIEFDHWYRVGLAGLKHTWPICAVCNSKLAQAGSPIRAEWAGAFAHYQEELKRYVARSRGPDLFSEDDAGKVVVLPGANANGHKRRA